MSRALLVVNFNRALCDNSRDSMTAAAARWNAEYVEISEANNPGIKVSPASLKCFCFKLCGADEFLILDADTTISARCPDPFEIFRGPELVAVRNGSERFGDLAQIRACERYEWEKLQAEEPRLAAARYVPGAYFNTGMMVVRRAFHEEMFRLISDIVQTDHGLGWNDQSPINMCASVCGVKVLLASERWNYIHPCMLGDGWLDMKKTGAYLYHGAGEPERIYWLPRVAWQ